MRGAEHVRTLLTSRLTSDVPVQLVDIDTRLGGVPTPPPKLYATQDRPQVALDQMPAVLAVVQDNDVVALPGDGGQLRWDVRWRVRVFVFFHGQTYEDTSRGRDRVTLAVRQALLADTALADGARILPSGWRESYSDVTEDTYGRSFAGAWVQVTVVVEETLPLATVATADTRIVEEHPAV